MLPENQSSDVFLESHRRLYPSIRNPNWLILRQRRKIFALGVSQYLGRNLRVLDLGGRLQPYRPLLGSRVAQYISIDLEITQLVDVAGSGEALPFRDAQFDFVICTQVLEYCHDPHQVAAEISRVLREGGIAFISAPAVFVRDHDDEYWRFLPSGLRYIFRDFQAVEVVAEGNSLVGFVRTVNLFIASFARPRVLAQILSWTVIPALNIMGFLIEGLGRNNDSFTANYSCWAHR